MRGTTILNTVPFLLTYGNLGRVIGPNSYYRKYYRYRPINSVPIIAQGYQVDSIFYMYSLGGAGVEQGWSVCVCVWVHLI